MAGFAFTVKSLIDSGSRFNHEWQPGTLETRFASIIVGKKKPLKGPWSKQRLAVRKRVICLSSKVYVWHTRTTTNQNLVEYGTILEVK